MSNGNSQVPATISQLINLNSDGGFSDLDQVISLAYIELRKLAHSQLGRYRKNPTLSTTALVHETYVRMAQHSGLSVADRRHFFVLCSRLMRQIIIDYLRRSNAGKRSAELSPNAEFIEPSDGTEQITQLAFEQALQALEREDKHLLDTVSLVWFAGFEPSEVATMNAVSVRTVQRDLARARAWIADALNLGDI